ncbi:transcriptional regulator Spx [Enterococcus sp.]|uniref:transcriptional regulator Spx n=1 Tax=Enterococcus sp. TaxID=35783 RepID=UPI000ED5DBD2|nr:transcriptional regulator Spx [Enterococcus sp.]HCM87581.1 transcriptional regulator Spx [Enterococcus sp.]
MITILLGNSCTSCRKTKAWFQEHDIPFAARNIDHEPLSKEDLKQIITLCPSGFDKIISKKSKIYRALNIDFDELSFNQLLVLLSQYPKLVKRPIIYDEKKIQVGFNEEEIRTLLPKEIKHTTRNYLYKVNTTMLYEDILAMQKTEFF